MSVRLRGYQEKDVAKLRSALKAGARRVLFQASVGYGKSLVILLLALAYAAIGGGVLVLSNRKAVVKQLKGRTGGRSGIAVMTVQAAAARLAKLTYPKIILVDEFHMGGAAAQYGSVFDAFPEAIVVGFTGTPTPESFKVLPTHIKGHDAAWLTVHGFLAPLRYVCPGKPDLSKVRTKGGDYVVTDLEKAMNRRDICGDAIASYRDHCVGKPTLVFCCTVKHAEDTAEEFRAAGFPCEVLTGKDKQIEEDRKIAHIAAGGLLFAVDKVSAGFDLPNLFAIISLRPTKSKQTWHQQMGRVARPDDDKTWGWVFDHCGNWIRCGYLTEDIDWQEKDQARKSPDQVTEEGEPISLRRCESCLSLFEAPATACPYCGHENGTDNRISKAEKIRVDELTEKEMEDARHALRQRQREEERGAKTLDDFKAIARARGYKPAWAFKRYELRARRQAPASPTFGADGWPL
ncbi:MAG: DEAD/DEAH box helicase [Alkalilacustris sp.]